MNDSPRPDPILRCLGLRDYRSVFEQQKQFTDTRKPPTQDELWFLEHQPVFTQGQAGKAEHVLAAGDIPVMQSDRGGQVTYHGPGQLVVYFLIDLKRLGLGIRELVERLEQAIVDTLSGYGIDAHARRDAPGVYVGDAKIASLGLRVRKGFSYHGIAINTAMDLEPFGRINPCGYQGLRMVQTSELDGPDSVWTVANDLAPHLLHRLGYPDRPAIQLSCDPDHADHASKSPLEA